LPTIPARPIITNYVFTTYVHLDPRGVIVAASLITSAGTVYALMLLPEWFGRLILFFITHTIYRVRVTNRQQPWPATRSPTPTRCHPEQQAKDLRLFLAFQNPRNFRVGYDALAMAAPTG
jgi:hypothetical protein